MPFGTGGLKDALGGVGKAAGGVGGLAGKLGLGFLALQGAGEAGNFITRMMELGLIRKEQAAQALANAQLISQDARDRDMDRLAAGRQADEARSERARMVNLADKHQLLQLLTATANSSRVGGIPQGMDYASRARLSQGDAMAILSQSQPQTFQQMIGLS